MKKVFDNLLGRREPEKNERPVRTDGVIPIIEERMQVGKREYESGGMRVHARLVETPVEQEIVLRDEHVHVDRRPVDRAAADNDYEPADIELRERAEQAFATKSSHVVEEVRLNKSIGEHKQKVGETLRHTEIEVERLNGKAPAAIPTAAPTLSKAQPTAGCIPIIEENIQLGKREYESGGVRVHAKLVSQPVEQEVSLRDEHVSVDRRRVDRGACEADYKPGDIEMRERAEEAFATKTARVVEEVRLGKTVTEHKEKVRDKVRHTEIDVERIAGRKQEQLRT